MNFLIGDIQGCCDALDRMLAEIGFSPSRDHAWILGDLVNRGPQSLSTLRRLIALDGAVGCLLGNHDLHLLAVADGAQRVKRQDTLDDILGAPDRATLLGWLRRQNMAAFDDGWLLVHAGVAPQWDCNQTLALAAEVETELRGPRRAAFMQVLYGDRPARWRPGLEGHDRLRFIVNALTRIRFCTPEGRLEFEAKGGAAIAPEGYRPWFEIPGRRTADTPVAFGHWSTLGLIDRPDLLALDTGCVWGGALSAARIDGGRRELFHVPCAEAQRPGSANDAD
jgi:bis(5'-nucleosyl)-tetraphosphatase (symmetrical)